MSGFLVNSVEGSGTFAPPTSEAENTAMNAALQALITGISGLTYRRTTVFSSIEKGVGAPTLCNWYLDGVQYSGNNVLSAAEVLSVTASLTAALLADPNIANVGSVDVSLFPDQDQNFWVRSGNDLNPLYAADDNSLVLQSQHYASFPQILVNYPAGVPGTWTTISVAPAVAITAHAGLLYLAFKALSANAWIAVRQVGDSNNYDQPTTAGPSMQRTPNTATNRSAVISCTVDSNTQFQVKGSGNGTLYVLHFIPKN